MTPNPLDWAVAALLLYSMVRAALNGFFREAFALAGLLIAFPLACWYYQPLAGQLKNLLTTPAIAQLASFGLILAAVTVSASFTGRVLRRGARTAGLGFADRIGGAIFGLVRGTGVAAAVLLGITTFLPTAPWIRTSVLAPYLLRAAHTVSFTMPPEFRFRLGDTLMHLNHSTVRWIKSGPLSHTRFTTLQP